jgi:hypothetical protein
VIALRAQEKQGGGRKPPKKCARESGRIQSAGELRSPLSRYGFAFAPDSTPLVGLRPPDPPYGGRLPLLSI